MATGGGTGHSVREKSANDKLAACVVVDSSAGEEVADKGSETVGNVINKTVDVVDKVGESS